MPCRQSCTPASLPASTRCLPYTTHSQRHPSCRSPRCHGRPRKPRRSATRPPTTQPSQETTRVFNRWWKTMKPRRRRTRIRMHQTAARSLWATARRERLPGRLAATLRRALQPCTVFLQPSEGWASRQPAQRLRAPVRGSVECGVSVSVQHSTRVWNVFSRLMNHKTAGKIDILCILYT